MARVTVEDCVEKTETRFELVMIAAQRARKIGTGASLTVERDNDKNPVISLREIAAETIGVEELKEELTKSHQRMVAPEEEDEPIDMMDGEEEWEKMAQRLADENRAEAAAAEGENIYGSEEITEEESAEPSLTDIAGGTTDG